MTKKLAGKVALVTGGSRGIGAATARALADEGADVAISYASSAAKAEAVVAELKSKGVRAVAFKAEQANSAEVEGLVKSVAEHFGRLDILVNNAGVFITGTVDSGAPSAADYDRQIAINIGGVVAAVRAASKIMGEGGRIITVGSGLASRVPYQGIADYSATKAAVATYTKGWARDLGPKGITVNVVQAGSTDTDMNPATSDFAVPQAAATALGRYGRPEEIAAAIAFLATPAASFITGASLDVDGGAGA